MEKTYYAILYNKLHSVTLAILGSKILYAITLVVYCLKKRRVRKHNLPDMDTTQAMQILSKASPDPGITFCIENDPVEQNVDLDLSIIIPVYNYAEVLRNTIESCMNQNTSYRYEVILVDDGSTDGSADIVEEYRKFEKVKILRQSNQGISAARNHGIDHARGRYLMFVDCDDYLMPQAVQTFLDIAYDKDVEIVEAAYYTFEKDHHVPKRTYVQKHVFLEKQNFDMMMNYTGYPWSKIYKRELFADVRFPMNSWFEDTLVKMILFRRCERYFYCETPLYGYRKYEGNFTETQVKSVRGVEHYWMLAWMIQTSRKLQIGNEESLYKTVIFHLGAIMNNRIQSVDIELQKAVFLLGAELLKENEPKEKNHLKLPFMYRELVRCYEEKNFDKWKLICKYM